jgi:glycosyltransferase involved in cell wall biosynthesis
MLCSVIIPLYNKGPFVGFAIETVLTQTHQNVEVIVVDDGSSDNGPEVVEAIQDPRVRLLRQTNGGVSKARNTGIAAATGELVVFLDADDWYGPSYVATMVELATRYPGQHFYATSFKRVRGYDAADWSTAPPAQVPAEVIDNFYERRRRNGAMLCTNSVAVWRRDLLPLQPCFPVGESHGEDQDLWFRLGERLQLVYSPVELVAYRIAVAGSLVTTQAYVVQRARRHCGWSEMHASAWPGRSWKEGAVPRRCISCGWRAGRALNTGLSHC